MRDFRDRSRVSARKLAPPALKRRTGVREGRQKLHPKRGGDRTAERGAHFAIGLEVLECDLYRRIRAQHAEVVVWTVAGAHHEPRISEPEIMYYVGAEPVKTLVLEFI